MKKISTIVAKFKISRNIQFEISNICENLVYSWIPEKRWKKITLETVKKCCTNPKFVKINSTPYSRDTSIRNAVVVSSIRTSLCSACVEIHTLHVPSLPVERVLNPEWPERRKSKTEFHWLCAEHPEVNTTCQLNFPKADSYAFYWKDLYDTKIIFSCTIW